MNTGRALMADTCNGAIAEAFWRERRSNWKERQRKNGLVWTNVCYEGMNMAAGWQVDMWIEGQENYKEKEKGDRQEKGVID